MGSHRTIAALAILACVACAGQDPLAPRLLPDRPASADDPVVARVEGHPIHLSRVRALCEELGRPPDEVLDGLVAMTLLAREAERRGLLERQGVRRAWKKALVQRLLEQEVEARVDPDDVAVGDIRAYYAQHYRNRGLLIEDEWRHIWTQIVADRRRAVYEELVGRLRSSTRIDVDDESVTRYLGEDGA